MPMEDESRHKLMQELQEAKARCVTYVQVQTLLSHYEALFFTYNCTPVCVNGCKGLPI